MMPSTGEVSVTLEMMGGVPDTIAVLPANVRGPGMIDEVFFMVEITDLSSVPAGHDKTVTYGNSSAKSDLWMTSDSLVTVKGHGVDTAV